MAQVPDHRSGGVLSGSLPQCGLKVETVPQLPSKAPFSKDFEDEVGLACESAAARQVARQVGLAAGTVRAHRQAVSGALGEEPEEAGAAADGRG